MDTVVDTRLLYEGSVDTCLGHAYKGYFLGYLLEYETMIDWNVFAVPGLEAETLHVEPASAGIPDRTDAGTGLRVDRIGSVNAPDGATAHDAAVAAYL